MIVRRTPCEINISGKLIQPRVRGRRPLNNRRDSSIGNLSTHWEGATGPHLSDINPVYAIYHVVRIASGPDVIRKPKFSDPTVATDTRPIRREGYFRSIESCKKRLKRYEDTAQKTAPNMLHLLPAAAK